MRLDAALGLCLVPFVGISLIGPRLASDWVNRPSQANVASVAPAEPRPQSGVARIRNRGDGHFEVEARIGARRIPFMVDTGATLVALTWESGRDLGLVSPSDPMTVAVSTANGTLKAKRVMLDRLEVEGIEVRDVAALVLPAGALSTNLLGMSYLARLNHFEMTRGLLVLEQ
jgi:aspartyl protease family protein